MSRSKVEGTKIAQAAKDLNVTSVTIRRYIQEFNIDTATDENGIKVLPAQALIELQEIRKLKEDGLTNPQVLESLDELRQGKGDVKTSKAKPKAKVKAKAKDKDVEAEIDEQDDQEQEETPKAARSKAKVRGKSALRGKKGKAAREVDQDQESAEDEEEEESISDNEAKSLDARRVKARKSRHSDDADEMQSDDENSPASDTTGDENENGDEDADIGEDGDKSKHSLTCQTCGKTFEHMNPRLRDCLECYRAKRKERRRGGDKHKKVIENPIAQQVLNKQRGDDKAVALAPERERSERSEKSERSERPERAERQERSDRSLERQERQERLEREKQERLEARAVALAAQPRHQDPTPWAQMQKPVRSYRKAIEETRLITGSLKRRLERPDLPEGERRWLEQVYAYQLILHQGWRHLAEYKSGGTNSSPKTEE